MKYDSVEKIDYTLQQMHRSHSDNLLDKLNDIIESIPINYSELINQAFIYKRVPKEYLLSSILFSVSASTGLTFFIKSMGYKNYGNSYYILIGDRGDTKSEAIRIATDPIKHNDDEDYQKYLDEINLLSDNALKVKRKQTLVQNATIEAAHKVHFNNPNSLGIAFDEIFGLIEKMSNSNSRDGIAWRNFFLEGYTNGHIDISRKTTESYRLNKSCPILIGALQCQFLKQLFGNGNLESGFIDRLFFTKKLTFNNVLASGKISEQVLENYNKSIRNILAYKRQSEIPEERIKEFEIKLNEKAEKRIFNYTQELINRQENAPSIIKEYMSKMQISIHKLCVVVFIMQNSFESTFASTMTEELVELAIDINEFYYLNFKSIVDNLKHYQENLPNTKSIVALAKKNGASQKSVAEITGKNKSTISRIWNKQ